MNLIQEINKKISPTMKERGFALTRRTWFFLRNDIAFCISFDAPNGILYATVHVMPLYIPCEFIYYTYGKRITNNNRNNLPLVTRTSTPCEINAWCGLFCDTLIEEIVPFFNQIDSPKKLIEHVEQIPATDYYWKCPRIFIDRLRMYSYTFIGELSRAKSAAKNYQDSLLQSSFLTKKVQCMYLEEIEYLLNLLMNDSTTIHDFCFQTIQNTKRVISNK